MTAGHFSSPNVIDIAAGAPQHSGSGKVRTESFVVSPAAAVPLVLLAPLIFVFPLCAGLYFQDRRGVFGEEFSSLRENGMSSDVVSFTSLCSIYITFIRETKT